MYSFSYLEPVCCSMSSSNCCFLTCIQISQEAGQVVWYSHLVQNFPQFIVIHTVKGFEFNNPDSLLHNLQDKNIRLLISLLCIYPEETKIEKDTCIPLFIAALFTIARTWKKLRYPLTDEWIKKLWYIYTMEYYSAIKSNAFESILMKWINLEPIIQSEVSQKEKDKYCILIHI